MLQSGRPPTWILCFTSFNHLALVVIITITTISTMMISNNIRNEIDYQSKGLQRFCQLSDLLFVWERLQASASQRSTIAATLSQVGFHNINTITNKPNNNNKSENNKNAFKQVLGIVNIFRELNTENLCCSSGYSDNWWCLGVCSVVCTALY